MDNNGCPTTKRLIGRLNNPNTLYTRQTIPLWSVIGQSHLVLLRDLAKHAVTLLTVIFTIYVHFIYGGKNEKITELEVIFKKHSTYYLSFILII